MSSYTRERCLMLAGGEELLFADGFDDAIIGVIWFESEPAVVYDRERVIDILAEDMDRDEAVEYFEHNIACAWLGPRTPRYLETLE